MSFASNSAFREACAAAGVKAPAGGSGLDDARAKFDALLFAIARRMFDLLRLLSHGKTLQPESVHDLAKFAALLHAPVGAAAAAASSRPSSSKGDGKSKSKSGQPLPQPQPQPQAGGHAGTVMTGSFYEANNAADASSYSTQNAAGSPVFASMIGDTVYEGGAGVADSVLRFGLAAPVFPLQSGGGSRAGGGWLTDEALKRMVDEYKSPRGGATGAAHDMRVGEATRPLLRRAIERNAALALRAAAAGGSKAGSRSRAASAGGPVATAAVVTRAMDIYCLHP